MPDNDFTYHLNSGIVRLPVEVADKWEEFGYGSGNPEHLYNVLWWLADMGYSIVPDAVYGELLKSKEI